VGVGSWGELNSGVRTSDSAHMSAVLPDEFPFNRAKPAPEPIAPVAAPEPAPRPAPAIIPDAVAPAPTAVPVAPPAESVTDEPLIEVRAACATLYRGPERRRSPRQALRAKAVYRPDSAALGESGHPAGVQVSNISMLGVRFWARGAVPAGAKGSVRMEVGPLKWSSRVRVVACVPCEDDDGYVIGCEFVGNELKRGRRTDAA